MTQQTLLLFIDAFRHDYVARTSFVRRLAATGATAAMREAFGFLPRAGYFGGLGPGDAGFTNMYCCDPAASPFGLARAFPDARSGRLAERAGARAWLDAEARKRLPPFAASYASCAAIPLHLAPWFDLAEKYAPWDRRVGYRTIFHELEDRGDTFFCCAWPDTNRLADHGDRALVERTLALSTPRDRLVFVHLQELDSVGHAYGPESSPLLDALDRTDRLVEALVSELRRRADRLDVLLFSDHGMVSVTGTVDVWAALDASGAAIGRDVVPFLDSTMARFWFPTRAAEPAVLDALATLPGRVLTDDDWLRLDLDGTDRRNGEVIFLAEPGHVIVPNFFQARADHVRGMHGYEPDCPDNMGVVIVNDADRDAPADLGIVGPPAIYTELRRLLGLGRPATVSVRPRAPRPPAGAFTHHPDPRAEQAIRDQMTRIVGETLRVLPDAQAIVLGGSFGRGEGGVIRDVAGRYTPVNDYDLVVVDRHAPASATKVLQRTCSELAAEFGTDFVHVSIWPSLEEAAAPTLANFDFRYGSRVLWGPPDLVERLPRLAAADIPPVESLQLLYNRLGGILTGLAGPSNLPRGASDRYLLNQVMKARIALGDWRLLRVQAYDVSYRVRRERFEWLAPGLAVPPGEFDAIVTGYDFKLRPDLAHLDDARTAAEETAGWLVAALIDATSDLVQRPISTAEDAADLFGVLLGGSAAAIEADNMYASRQLDGDDIVRVRPDVTDWVRHAVYASFPLVARALGGDGAAFARASAHLNRCFTPPWPTELTPDNWETVRHRLSRAWLGLVH